MGDFAINWSAALLLAEASLNTAQKANRQLEPMHMARAEFLKAAAAIFDEAVIEETTHPTTQGEKTDG